MTPAFSPSTPSLATRFINVEPKKGIQEPFQYRTLQVQLMTSFFSAHALMKNEVSPQEPALIDGVVYFMYKTTSNCHTMKDFLRNVCVSIR